MDDSQSPTRKRRRSQIGDVSGDATVVNDQDASDEAIVRDKKYYKGDGDCVILVGRVLFKLHRHMLQRDASAFSNMFSMPQGTAGSQATTDEDPLVLYDDVDDFRALCWMMYALPTVFIEQYRTATANIKDLVSLYLIAHKYHFEAYETFARELLRKHCTNLHTKYKTAAKEHYLINCPETRLESVLRIAALTDQPSKEVGSLSTILQKLWVMRIESANESTAFALAVGEGLGLRSFIAELYYLELTRMESKRLDNSVAWSHPVTDLAPHQKLVLYQGYWSLRHYWSYFLEIAPQKQFFCSGHFCKAAWERSWFHAKGADSEVVSKRFHPMQVLDQVEARLRIGYIMQGEGEDKIGCALEGIKKMQTDLQESLAVHFLGPLPASASTPDS